MRNSLLPCCGSSLKLMEDRHGSLKQIGELLSQVSSGDAPLVSTVFWILALGLRHEKLDDGQPLDEDWLLDNGDTRQLQHYAEVAFTALVESLPGSAIKPETALDPTMAKANPVESNGANTSGLPWPSSAAAPPNSGTA